jgi:hypothetical protein
VARLKREYREAQERLMPRAQLLEAA